MAKKPAAPPDPEAGYDVVAKELAEQIRSNEALLRGLKYEYGQKLLDAQQGGGDVPAAGELRKIKDLELALTNDRMFLEAREMTRRP